MSCGVVETRARSRSVSVNASFAFTFSFTCSCSFARASFRSVSKSHRSETSVIDTGIRSGLRNRVSKKTVSPAAQTPNCSPPLFFFLPPAFLCASSHVEPPSPPFARCAGTTPSDSIARHRRSETKPPTPSFSSLSPVECFVSRVSAPKRPSSKPTTTSPTSISGTQTPIFIFESSSVEAREKASRLASTKRNSRRYVACAAAETPSAQNRSFSKCDAAAGDPPHRAICLPSAKCRCSRARAHGVFTEDPSGKKERDLVSTSSAASYAGSADA